MLLTESIPFVPSKISKSDLITESQDGKKLGGLLIVEGIFQRYDIINANKRLYPKELWDRCLKEDSVVESLKNGSMLGLLEHPEDGLTKLDRVPSHRILKVWDTNDGYIRGQALILNTTTGQNLAAIFEGGGTVGISSRGDGELENLEEGNSRVIPESFILETWDFVYNNSVTGARPVPVKESKEEDVVKDKLKESAINKTKHQEGVNMSKLGEMRKLELRVSQLPKLEEARKYSITARAALIESVQEIASQVSTAVAEDAGIANYGKRLLDRLNEYEDGVEAEETPAEETKTEGMTLECFTSVVGPIVKEFYTGEDVEAMDAAIAEMFDRFVKGEAMEFNTSITALIEKDGKDNNTDDGEFVPEEDVVSAEEFEETYESIISESIKKLKSIKVVESKRQQMRQVLIEARDELVDFEKKNAKFESQKELIKEARDEIVRLLSEKKTTMSCWKLPLLF